MMYTECHMNVKRSEILCIGTANFRAADINNFSCFGQTLGHISANKSVNREITKKILN